MDRRWIVMGLIGVALLSNGFPALAQSVEEAEPSFCNHIHISVDGGATPFYAVQYAVRVMDGAGVVLQTKQYPQVPVYDNRLEVITPLEAETLFKQLARLDAMTLTDAEAKEGMGLTYDVEFGLDGKRNSFKVTGPELLDDLRYAQIIEAARGMVERHTGVASFRDIVVPESHLGLLNLRTFPPVEVTIDDVPVGRTTPLFGFELTPGSHVATLYAPSLNVVRKVKFTIQKGQITALNLNIKP
jgi:hypothetical protein